MYELHFAALLNWPFRLVDWKKQNRGTHRSKKSSNRSSSSSVSRARDRTRQVVASSYDRSRNREVCLLESRTTAGLISDRMLRWVSAGHSLVDVRRYPRLSLLTYLQDIEW